MSRYSQLMQRIHAGERILIDGATGTEIERRGVPQLHNAWNGGGALSHPDILRAVHEDYLSLGAEIIISNNFATHYYALRDAGVAERFEAYNRRGVELAIEARDNLQKPNALVAAGISYWSWSGNHPALEDLKTATERQVEILAAAGADLFMLEMMIDIDKMLILLDAAQSSGLPVWVGFTCEPDAQGVVCLRNGEPLSDALAAIGDRQVDLVNIMHTQVEHIDTCLDGLQSNWPGPIGVYAHTGEFVGDHLNFDSTISPADYCAAAGRWLDRGVSVIGGCCGIGPRHIEQLAKLVEI
ncbi:MAG: homocysteine S-methyltransferase family protein [Gammaproteobacteria bacterium]|nr:MAG: homocysteine S-methyltransferase family protein [Gammaproteobacteria bacterium]UCH41392.1 MAG: homocysteine S-methyltransferase family protein [Gammaproteobacteria bacterium]